MMIVKGTGIWTAVAVFLASLQVSMADTFTFAIGEWPPFISEKAPGLGHHSQRVTEVYRSSGHEVSFQFLPWRRSLEMTKRGSLPATFSWSFVNERTTDFIYPENPIAEVKDVYFFRKDRFPDGLPSLSFSELKAQNLSVVGISGYWYEAPLRKSGVSFQAVSTEEQAWAMLLHGRADIYIENDVVGRVHSRNVLQTEADEITLSEPIRVVPLFILFSRIHPDGRRMAEIWDDMTGKEPQRGPEPAIR